MKRSEMLHKCAQRLRRIRRGFTTAELLVVVAIILILGGVTFIAVWNYQRSSGQLERDSIAKEIFIAAQNHLTAARNEFTGDLGIEDPEKDGVYYFVVNEGTTIAPSIVDAPAEEGEEGSSDTVTGTGKDAFEIMLPFGSIEESVRIKGSYLIRYQKETATILDVFYCTTSGTRFDHELIPSEYSEVLSMRGDEKRSARRNWDKDGSILGWYGDVLAAELADITLAAPEIVVTNADQLKVEISDPNAADSTLSSGTYSVRLLITGESSKKVHYLNVTDSEIILDDITETGPHFCNRTFEEGSSNDFIPGENLHIRAVAFSSTMLSNVAYSGEKITNSLFASISDSKDDDVDQPDTAYIGNFRHLENLSVAISMLDATDSEDNLIDIVNAVQVSDLKWGETGSFWADKRIQTAAAAPEKAKMGCFMPVDVKTYRLNYDGQGYSISGLKVEDWSYSAGLFGEIRDCSVKNLELIDFSVSGSSYAGTLAGTVTVSSGDARIMNVLARNSREYTGYVNVRSSGASAGGLIGSISGGEVVKSAASVYVSSSVENAGGLIGMANGSIVTGCYSGGHTAEGKYSANADVTAAETEKGLFNVIGYSAAGGLIGETVNVTVDTSYSTCSAYVTNGPAGGVMGKTSGSSFSDCYAAGLVGCDTSVAAATVKAFLGSGTPGSVEDCYYYSIVNEVKASDSDAILYLEPGVETGIEAFDRDVQAYSDFIGAQSSWKDANPYDSILMRNYKGKYNLRTVSQLGLSAGEYAVTSDDFVSTHYGDWPSPETLIVNL